MSKKDYVKQKNGKEITVQEAVDEYLDDEIETLSEKLDKSQITSLGQMHIRLVSDEVIELNSAIEPMVILGIARLDDKHYGAIYRMVTKKTAVEELHVNKTLTEIKGSFLIDDVTEWTVISNFFINNHIFERNRIIDWAFQAKMNDTESLINTIKKVSWLEEVNKQLKQKHKKILTPHEIAQISISRQWPKTGKK